MRRYAFVVFWIALVMGSAVAVALWVDSASGDLRAVLAFEPFHVVGHLVLYAVLGGALVSVARGRPAFATVVFIATAVAQECAQSLVLGRSLSADSVYDVGVDLVGGVIGVVLAYAITSRERAQRAARQGPAG